MLSTSETLNLDRGLLSDLRQRTSSQAFREKDGVEDAPSAGMRALDVMRLACFPP